jgi:DNA-binding transcriptional LysR family regulator
MASDLVTAVPLTLARHLATTLPLHVFAVPVPTPPVVLSEAWHPRVEADPAHVWLRRCVRGVFANETAATRARR